ncbi:MAG: RimK family alpha-L-glutamate ligase [Clostridia bacterium]|nr:RimK family alpha-L-glutamate ligase [Clostridia bacterium]
MKRAIIIINAYSTLPTGLNQAERLKTEFARLGVNAEIRRNGFFAYLDGEGELINELKDYDFCVYLDKDKYTSAILEKSGLRLFNSHAAVRVCDDKMETHLALAVHGIPMPTTVGGLLCYDAGAQVKGLDFIEKTLGYPVIVKESYGSLGKGVYKADDRNALESLCEKLKCTPHLFQKFISSSAGKDVRVIVIGGKAVAAMQRKSDTDFRSNLELGGTAKPAQIDDCLRDMCELTAKTLGLDYCGIDVLYGENGGYLVCEVNSNAFFGGIERVTGANIARLYAEYICSKIYDSSRRQ